MKCPFSRCHIIAVGWRVEILRHGVAQAAPSSPGNVLVYLSPRQRGAADARRAVANLPETQVFVVSIFENLTCNRLLKHSLVFRACIVCHFCQNNCFFILLSWLPTYFHDNFPGAKSWIFNVVPWALMIPGVACASYVTGKVLLNRFEVGHARKTSEVICMGTEAICLLLMGEYVVLYEKIHFCGMRERRLQATPTRSRPRCC